MKVVDRREVLQRQSVRGFDIFSNADTIKP